MKPRLLRRSASGSIPFTFAVPAGFRHSHIRPLGEGEVVASTYVVRDEIARTDSGIVFSARDMMFNRAVALKLGWRDRGATSLLEEARRCASVAASCAVQIHNAGNHNGTEYVVGEHVQGTLLEHKLLRSLPDAVYLARFRALVEAVASAHAAGVAIGEISGATVLVDSNGRIVLGSLSLSQVPASGRHGRLFAPEIVRGDVEAGDPEAAEAIDLYGLGCVAVEMAQGTPLFSDDDPDVEARRHVLEFPPTLSELRPDLPGELSDVVEWLLAKRPEARPRTANDVLLQLSAIIDRLVHGTRPLRILIVDDDAGRARWLRSLARRAHAASIIEISCNGSDAAHKLNRDHPDLVFIEAGLHGVMNALELCTYARSIEGGSQSQILLLGDVSTRDQAMFAEVQASRVSEDNDMANAVLDHIRSVARGGQRNRISRSTISG